MILDDIVEQKKQELARWKDERPVEVLRQDACSAPPTKNFRQALEQPGVSDAKEVFRVIAEIKKSSPSRGILRSDFDPVAIAKTYESCGAAAISVLTDMCFFGGDVAYLRRVREETRLPLLMKDFIIDPYQIVQARANGADAVLLIAALLTVDQLSEYLALTHQLAMSALVEVHTRDELGKALATNAEIVGINNRDLKTFQVTIETTRQLLPLIPAGKIVVSESGIASKEVMHSLAHQGVHAFLIGEALMSAKNIDGALRSLLN